MKSERIMPKVGSLYKLRDHDEYVVECLEVHSNDAYSPYSGKVKSVGSGWTMDIHGVNMYEDGSIDWDFSTNGYFS